MMPEPDNKKQRARIENWYKHPFAHALLGKIVDHPRQDEFKSDLQMTSRIVELNETEGYCETLNTTYTLGKKYEPRQSDSERQGEAQAVPQVEAVRSELP